MKIKIGYKGKFITLPTHVNCDWKNIEGGIVFQPDNINDEALLESIIDLLSKYPAHIINDYLISKKQ